MGTPSMSTTGSEVVWAVAVALLYGAVLQVADVSAGNGSVIDWRTTKSGNTYMEGGDAFDVAYLFVTLVGNDAALATLVDEAAEPPAPAPLPVRVHAFMETANGGRRRTFDAGPFRVMVEPHEDDAAQAAFADRLAEMAQTVIS